MMAYFQRRWFLLSATVGLILAVRFPAETRQVLDHFHTAHVAALALFFASLTLGLRRLWEAIRYPGPVLLAVFLSWVLSPCLAWFAAPALLPDKFQTGLLVVSAVPCTLGSAAVWTRLAGGNEAIALMTTFVTNSLVFVGTVGILALLTGLTITLDPSGAIVQLLLFVVTPIIVAQVFRLAPPVSKTMDAFKSWIGIATQICILVIIVKSAVAASTELGKAQALGLNWSASELLQVALVCAGMHLVLLTTGFYLGDMLFSPESARAVAIAGSQKTLPVAALIIADFFPQEPLAIVPILFYHVLQLILDTFFAERVRLLVRSHPEVSETDLTAAET